MISSSSMDTGDREERERNVGENVRKRNEKRNLPIWTLGIM